MLYQRPSFTCPAAGAHTSQQQWDLATLTRSKFIRKYQITALEYETLQQLGA